jgi:hypothetical protein
MGINTLVGSITISIELGGPVRCEVRCLHTKSAAHHTREFSITTNTALDECQSGVSLYATASAGVSS